MERNTGGERVRGEFFGGGLMMREEILEYVATAGTPEEKLVALRGSLQAALLRSFHESGAFSSISLSGAAATNFSDRKPGVVDVLEFIIVDKAGYAPEKWVFKARRYLRYMGLDSRIAFARRDVLHSGWVKIPELLAEAGLSTSPADTVDLKISISTRPPVDIECKVMLVELAGECFALRGQTPLQ
jgi:hypothetical protein